MKNMKKIPFHQFFCMHLQPFVSSESHNYSKSKLPDETVGGVYIHVPFHQQQTKQ